MGRANRVAVGGMAYHVLNRANAGMTIFESDHDYAAFQRVVVEAREREDMRILSYCIMPNHWHFVLWPRRDGDLSRFTGWLTLTHTQRWHARRGTVGSGHLYQGRFKSFPIQEDEHLLTVCRYVERNARRANLVDRAEDWQPGSLWQYRHGSDEDQHLLSPWPLPRPRQWVALVNRPQPEEELKALRHSIVRGAPFGDAVWVPKIARKLGLESTLRPRGRPKKAF